MTTCNFVHIFESTNKKNTRIADLTLSNLKFVSNCFSMEVVGRYPTQKEEDEYEILHNTPVWLPTRTECSQFKSDIIAQLKWLREAIIISM